MLLQRRKEYHQSRREFARFAHTHELELKTLVESSERGKDISKTYGLYSKVFYGDTNKPKRPSALPSSVQVWAGKIPSGRQDANGKAVTEGGLTLVYSLGPTGRVLVLLYPFASDVCSPIEQSIVLAHMPMNRAALSKRVHSDIANFIAYGYATALDADPSWLDTARIWWLRFTRPTHVEGKYTDSRTKNFLAKVFAAGGSGTVSGIMKLATPFLTAVAAAWLGIKFAK